MPVSLPFITDLGGDPLVKRLEWTELAGADPNLGAAIKINLTFVPEPGTALLMGLGLAGLGLVGRSQRRATNQQTV